ncbi:MAG: hypothetical protein ISP66_04695, partial [Flavobacteriaceae bacterium]|nr:hypothetical protein [Flavobacteriaceae bacterium]
LKLDRLPTQTEEVRIQTGKIAIEATFIANEATKSLTNEKKKRIYKRLSQRNDREGKSLSKEDGSKPSYNGRGSRSGSSIEEAESGGRRPTDTEIQKAQEQSLEQYAKAQGLWFNKTESATKGIFLSDQQGKPVGKFFERGMEVEVFRSPNGNKVVKSINPCVFNLNPLEFIDRLAIFNSIFKSEHITLEGFGQDGDGNFLAIIKQGYIKIDRGLTEKEASDYMKKLGFKNESKTFGLIKNVNTNWERGKKRLEESGYNVEALFGNETMAQNSRTKKLLERAKKMDHEGKTLQEIKSEMGWFVGLDGNWK